ncbi:serine hydrolase domain-containing protein [Tunicatimonas pelagia]|uniref:serine hydrolase domain-containing protein n=1 Tax=Tunicatimonas pelagia TaxID=931531 RepID=UPI002666A380|nr:serine hydrolase domain-containing protein [Tunicatimonas pelagia]WKN42421.1 serine hydrolase [Tunicatimonas pelagia]
MRHLLTALVFFVTITVSAQTKSTQQSPPLSEAKPESVGMSAERLARIDAMAKEAVEDNEVPGLVALVARKGKIVYHKAFGTANSSGRKLEKDAIFRIASQTKAVTATAVMMLWEEGLFRLDDPISKYIPEFKNPQVLDRFRYADTSYTTQPAENEITIRHLLTHTSGLGYGFIDGDERFKMIYEKAGIIDAFTTQDITIEENIKKLAKLPLHFNPGEKYSYAEGLDVLGYFVEIMSGQPYDDFLREHLFEPLGMNDTWFYLPNNKADRLVAVQRWNDSQWERYSGNGYDADYPVKGAKTFFAGGAGLSSTAKDYATFLQMYLNGGELNGIRILSRMTVQSIMGNQIGDFWEGSGRHYGLAFGVLTPEGQDQGGRGSTGTFDWGGYFNTQYFADPQEELIGIIMKQTRGSNGDGTGWKFRILVNQAVDD